MNELFRLAAESMLKIYGSDAVLLHQDSSRENIRISPLFNAKLQREDSSSRVITADSNVVISGCAENPVPQSDRLLLKEKEWSILSVNELCPGIFELELKQ